MSLTRKTSYTFKQSRSEKKLPANVQLQFIHDTHPTLEVFIKSGSTLVVRDRNGASDPYCEVSVGDLSLKTDVKKKTLNPVWNEMFDFSVKVDSNKKPLDRFNIQVWDKDLFKRDFMGTCFVDLSKLEDGKTTTFDLPLTGVEGGVLHFELTAHNFGDKPVEKPAEPVTQPEPIPIPEVPVQQQPIITQPVQPTATETASPRNSVGSDNGSDTQTTPRSATSPPSTSRGSSGLSKGSKNRWERYKKEKKLSAGGQGTVYQGRDLSTNKEIAIKRVVCSNINEANYALQEAIAIKNVKHTNIVEYNDVFLEDIGEGAWGICLVMEYYQKGDLSGLLKKRASGEKKKYVPVRTVVSYLLQIVSALEFLHSMKIMHRDIKPQNVFVTEKYDKVLLGDFGMVRSVEESMTGTKCGSPVYMAPEVGEGKRYYLPADVWSFGVLAYEVMTLKMGQNHYVLAMSNKEEYRNSIRKDINAIYANKNNSAKQGAPPEMPELADMVLDILHLEPDQRLTATQCVERLQIMLDKLPM